MSATFGLPNRVGSNWEQDPRTYDGHPHEWVEVLTCHVDGRRWVEDLDGPERPAGKMTDLELVVLCVVCRAPRCGYSGDRDPCIQVRHHAEPHIYASGSLRKVGA